MGLELDLGREISWWGMKENLVEVAEVMVWVGDGFRNKTLCYITIKRQLKLKVQKKERI